MTRRMKLRFAIIILTLSIWNDISSQELFNSYRKILNDKGASEIQTEIDSLLKIGYQNQNLEVTSKIAHDYSFELYLIGDYVLAAFYAQKEVDDLVQIGENNKVLSKALYNLGRFLSKNEQYDEAITNYKEVIRLNNYPKKVAQSYCELGSSYHEIGDYYAAVNYYNIGIPLLRELNENRSLFSQLINGSVAHSEIKSRWSFNRLFNYLKEAERIYIRDGKSLTNRNLISLNTGYANFFLSELYFDFSKSRTYFLENLELSQKEKDSSLIALTYTNLAELYFRDNRDSVLYFAKKAIDYSRDRSKSKIIAYYNISREFNRKHEFELSLNAIQNGINSFTDAQKNNNGLPSKQNMHLINGKDHLLESLIAKTLTLLNAYFSNLETTYLFQVINTVIKVDELVTIFQDSSKEKKSKLFWRREASQAYLYGAYASHLLGDSEKAFEFMEKNKALLLSESVLKNTEFANLPKHISDDETNRQKLIYNLESKLSTNSDNTILQDSLFNAKRSHEKYVDSLKIIYPKYFARKINVEQIPLDQVKKEMNSNDALISYIWNDFDRNKQLVVGLISTKEDTKTFIIENIGTLNENIKQYQRLISQPFETVKDQEDFKKVVYELYQQLFPSDEIRELVKNKNLMIIADGLLQNIPFESLITEKNTNNYLILQGDIHYSYSYSFLKHNEKVNRRSDKTFIGYSPTKFNDSTLVSLKFSKSEVESIQSELNGIIKLKENATKSDFMRNSSDVKIIHLATHADAGDYPWIAFQDERMELHELYTYKNNAELVTLSACNTSLGEMAEGEGVISLARGFFHSGSKSVVSSLWRVNDESTSEIMTSFYQYLQEGQQKSEALSNSKRDYIKNHSLSEQSPYYWSSFVLIGDPGEIKIDSQNHLYYTLLLLVIPVGLLIRKKLKKAG